MKVEVRNSFSKMIDVVDPNVTQLLTEVLTYKNEIDAEKSQLFYQLKRAKRFNNKRVYFSTLARIKYLEENEYVCLYQKDGTFPTGLLNIVLESLKVLEADYEYVDLRIDPGSSAILRWNNLPWEPRYYQDEMIKLGEIHKRGVFEAAVGSGKSLVMAYLVKLFSVNSLIVVPSTGLGEQLYNEFCNWFGYANVEQLDAKKIRKLKRVKPISIITVQSLGSLVKTGEIEEFLSQIDALYVDEVHHAAASTYTKLLPYMDHIYYRFGFTGTFLRNDSKTLEMWSFLSNVLYEYPAWKAIEDGNLTKPHIIVHQLDGNGNRSYQKEYDNNYCESRVFLEKIHKIVENAGDSQVLILVNKKDKCGLVIHEYLNAFGIENYYASGDDKKEHREHLKNLFNDKKIKILIGSSVYGEGVDIRSTDHLIMAQGGKSEVSIVQAAGRVVRKYEGKEIAWIHDFLFNNTNYLCSHLDERLDIYSKHFRCEVDYR